MDSVSCERNLWRWIIYFIKDKISYLTENLATEKFEVILEV